MPKNKKSSYKSAFLYLYKFIKPHKKWYWLENIPQAENMEKVMTSDTPVININNISFDGDEPVTIENIRSKTAYVPQDAMLFRGSIYDNIACRNENATEDDMIPFYLMTEIAYPAVRSKELRLHERLSKTHPYCYLMRLPPHLTSRPKSIFWKR